MKPTKPIDLKEAQALTDETLARFETAMDHLANKVDSTTYKIHHYKNIAALPKKWYRQASGRIKNAVEPVRKNPSPFVVGFLGILASFAIYKSVQARAHRLE